MRFRSKEKTTISAGLSLPEVVVDKIDSMRGDISRSRYTLRLIEIGIEQIGLGKELPKIHVG